MSFLTSCPIADPGLIGRKDVMITPHMFPLLLTPPLPERASLEHLKKQAKARLAELRRDCPDATLAEAQFEIARANGFPSWRALKAAFDRRTFDGELVVGDWIGRPEGGIDLALHVRQEAGRLRAQLDVPGIGYFGDPVEGLSVVDGVMNFRITVRAVNATYEGRWNSESSEWQGVFTHDGRAMPLNLRRGVLRAARLEGLDGLWDGQEESGDWLTLRIVTDDRGTFAWLCSSLLPDRWFQAVKIERNAQQVTAQWKTLRIEGLLDKDGERIDGQTCRQDANSAMNFVRRVPGGPAPWRKTV